MHGRQECRHGILYQQCRCPHIGLPATIVSCDLITNHQQFLMPGGGELASPLLTGTVTYPDGLVNDLAILVRAMDSVADIMLEEDTEGELPPVASVGRAQGFRQCARSLRQVMGKYGILT